MSTIQTAPVEILLDIFQANDPADTETLQLTCRRFHDTIVQNVNALPTRLVCELDYDESRQVGLYRAPPNNTPIWRAARESIASSSWQRHEIQHLYETFGCKTAIRTVRVIVPDLTEPNGPLTQLIDDFPSVKGAVRLDIDTWAASDGLPTDPVLAHFERLETILMDMRACDKPPSFWTHVFATKAFRRVPNFIM
ncbi:hypothetical protein AAVH_32969, partial [Aphelenchoides avenae]